MTWRATLLLGALALSGAAPAVAAERYVLIVSGANGDASYADQYGRWRQSLVTALREQLKIDDRHIETLFDGGDADHAAAIEVRWPSGRRQTLAGPVAGGGTIDIVEP